MTHHANTRRGALIERWVLAQLRRSPGTVLGLQMRANWKVSSTGVLHALKRLMAAGKVTRSEQRPIDDKSWPAWVYSVTERIPDHDTSHKHSAGLRRSAACAVADR